MKKKIAVIGGGAAGIGAAWQLSKSHDVLLFEKEDYLGGHAYSHKIEDDCGHSLSIDMGVDYFNERLSPNLHATLDKMGIKTFVAPLSMRIQFPGQENFWSNTSIDGRLRELLDKEFSKFHRDMSEVFLCKDESFQKMSIHDFLIKRGYSEEFKYLGLEPLMTIYSGCNAPSLEYNLTYAAVSFFLNLLSFYSAGYWRKSEGGIRAYIDKIANILGDRVHLDTDISNVELGEYEIKVHFANGKAVLFDQVIFATHADITLKLIANPSKIQSEILSGFKYVPVKSSMHRDKAILQKNTNKEYAQFSQATPWSPENRQGHNGHLTRISNHLMPYKDVSRPLLVTFDSRQELDPDKVDCEKNWKLPKLRPEDFARKTRFKEIQGFRQAWFCGTDTSFTGHEGALVSGLVVASKLGSPYPYKSNKPALAQFNAIKEFMGI